MAPRIGPRKPRRIYLAEWRAHRGLTQKQLGDRLGVAGLSVSRWERSTALLNTNVMAAIAEALSIEPQDLYRDPRRPSADELLRDQPQEVLEQAMTIIRTIRR
jgi:transcriptional regulator with XRE-family HTH domain